MKNLIFSILVLCAAATAEVHAIGDMQPMTPPTNYELVKPVLIGSGIYFGTIFAGVRTCITHDRTTFSIKNDLSWTAGLGLVTLFYFFLFTGTAD